MDPDSDSPVTRVERTFWAVWYYITEAVNRFLRTEPTDIVSSDPNSLQEAPVNSEPVDNGHTEDNASRGEVDEEQPLAAASLLSSSGAVVVGELCKMKDTDLGHDEEYGEKKTQLSGGSESKVSEEGQSTREGQFSQTENDDAGLLTAKDTRGEKAEEEENIHQKLCTHRQDELPDDVEVEENTKKGSLTPTDDGMSENTEEETQRTMTPDYHEKTEEANKIHHEDKQVLEEEEDIEIKLCTITDSGLEEEDNMLMEEARVQREDAATAVMHEEVEIGNGVLQLVSEYENKSDEGEQADNKILVFELGSESDIGVKGDTAKEEMMGHKSESDKAEDEQEEEDERMLDESEQSEEENMNELENKQAINKEPQQEEDIKIVKEDRKEKDILTECVACSLDDLQSPERELHTTEFTCKEEEDVAKKSEMHSKTRETDDVGETVNEKSYVTTTELSVNETFFDKDHVKVERLSSNSKEGYMETACKHTSITVEPEAETGQEISEEPKNVSLGMCEGQVVVSQELNSLTCEETQEGVPEYNNDPGPDENTTQRYLEVVNYEEIETTQLPEEVGSQELETLQNSSYSAGADYSLVEEHRKEEQESTEDNKEHAGKLHHTHTGLLQETETPLIQQVIEESGVLYEEEERKLLVHSMKTEISHSEKELETHVGLTDDTDETAVEQQDGTEELLVDFETDEGFSDLKDALGDGCDTTGAVAAEEAVDFADETSKFIDAEEQNMTDTSFLQESVDTISFDQNFNMTPTLLEDIMESGLLQQSIETKPKTVEDCTVDVHDAVIDSEETGYGPEEEAAGDEMQNKNQIGILNLQLVTPLEQTDKNKNALIASSEADEALEISNEETLTDTEAADELMTLEFKPKDATVISTEEMVKHATESERSYAEEESSSISGNQDVIDEEILDLWIQAASSENTEDMKQQEGPERMDIKEQSNEEQAEISSVQTETEKEQLVKSNSGESGLVSNTELSSLTAESGFLDQSVCVWDTQNSETSPFKSAATESFQDIYDTLASISESTDISDLSTQQFKSESQDILIEEVAETGQSDLKEEESLTETGGELHTTEFTFKEEEDVAKKSEMHSKTRETDNVGETVNEKSYVTTTELSVNETFFDKDHVKVERLSSNSKEGYMETACKHTSITVEPEAETGQEISEEPKNVSLGMCEGQVVVSQELNSLTCEETQEGVPEYNNDPGPDENTTQRYLEVVNYEEIETTQLPEEVGSQELETLQNSSYSAGADYSLVEEHRKEEQESTEDNKEHAGKLHHTHTGLLQETETPLIQQVIEESGVLYEEEERKLLVHSMKTEISHSEKELETHVGLTDDTDETAVEQQDGTEELLVDFETDEGFSDLKDALGDGCDTTGAVAAEEAVDFADETSKFIDAEEQNMTDTSFLQESVDTISFDQNFNMTPTLLEDIMESGLLQQSIETKPKTVEDCTVDVHDAVIDSEETGYGPEEEAAGDEMQNKNQIGILNLQLVTPLEQTDKNKNALIASSEADEALEISNEETLTDTEAADELMTLEFKPKDATVISTEEMVKHATESERSYAEEESSSISGNQDVIDEEILDLWIQAASSENTEDMKQQEGPERMDIKEQSNEEQAEISSVQTETEKEQLVKSNSGESGLVSNTELSSLTAESGFLDQSVCVWDTQNSETSPFKSAATESFQDIYDTLASISESTDISDLSTQQFKSESQDILIEEVAETGQSDLKEEESLTETGFYPDSGVLSSEARQEKSNEEQVELLDTETQKDTEAEATDLASKTNWKDTEEADFKSPTEEAEETNFEDEAFGLMASHSPNEFKPIQSGQSKSGLEVLSEEGIMSTDGLHVDTWSESDKFIKLPSLDTPQPGWSEDESLPGQNRAEVEEQLTTTSEGLIEVDTSALDFTAQKSRIAVKNPHVRPPKDARSLLHMPSVEPTPSSNLPVKVPPKGVPLGGLGIGIKLPGLGAGFPVLKKTQRVVREENSPETLPQEPETKPKDKSDTPKQDETQHRPKWMPPKQPGFGNPLMSELKTKLKKPTKE